MASASISFSAANRLRLPPSDAMHSLSGLNITLLDGNGTCILQQFAPTSLRKRQDARRSAVKGKELLDEYLAKKAVSRTKMPDGDNQQKAALSHPGIWQTTGNGLLDFTLETRCEDAQLEALKLLRWIREHFAAFLMPVRQQLHPSFQANVALRAGRPWDWLTSIFAPKHMRLLHPWFTTAATFTSFSPGAHTNFEDQAPSFLFNFGAAGFLELPEYGVRIRMEPLDLVVLNSSEFLHRTQPCKKDDDHGRWAFSAFYHSSIFNMEGMRLPEEDDLEAVFADG